MGLSFLGRPFVFPDWPGLNCAWRGGFLYPTEYFEPVSLSMGFRSPTRYFIKSLSAYSMYGMITGMALPASDRCINVDRIELNGVATAASSFGGDECRSGAQEAVEHDLPAC